MTMIVLITFLSNFQLRKILKLQYTCIVSSCQQNKTKQTKPRIDHWQIQPPVVRTNILQTNSTTNWDGQVASGIYAKPLFQVINIIPSQLSFSNSLTGSIVEVEQVMVFWLWWNLCSASSSRLRHFDGSCCMQYKVYGQVFVHCMNTSTGLQDPTIHWVIKTSSNLLGYGHQDVMKSMSHWDMTILMSVLC